MDTPEIRIQSPAALTPRPRNARTHSAAQLRQLADSIRQFGFTNPILVDADNFIIAGHGRWAAAKQLKLAGVPTLCLAHLSPAEVRAYVIADNQLALNAGWDEKLLALELQELTTSLDLDFEVTITGFDMPAIDLLLDTLRPAPDEPDPNPADHVPGVDRSQPAVTQPGDVWVLARHRLCCGNALEAASYTRLLGEQRVEQVFIDPPYNVRVQGHVSGLGVAQHPEFAMASGEMSTGEFTAFLAGVFERLVAVSVDGALHYIFIDWRHMAEVMAAGQSTYSEFKHLCVWNKKSGGMGSLYRSQHELCFIYKAGTAAHVNNIELGKHGRYRTNIWSYPGMNAFGANRDEALAMHPTVKPVALVADALMDASRRGQAVLDVFAGSGTTLVAAERTGRHGYAMELDPHYCDVIVRRLMRLGLPATLAVTGESFDAVAMRRAAEAAVPQDSAAVQP